MLGTFHSCSSIVQRHLLICHLVLQGFELALMLAPQLSLLQAELTAQLLLLLSLALPSQHTLSHT